MALNILTHDKAISFYPLLTHDQQINVSFLNLGISDEEEKGIRLALDKYTTRGWPLPGKNQYADLLPGVFPGVTRWVGDKMCWTIHLPTSGLDVTERFDYLSYNSWEVCAAEDNISLEMHMEQSPLCYVKYRYMWSPHFYKTAHFCFIVLMELEKNGKAHSYNL